MNQWKRRITIAAVVLGLSAAGGWACSDAADEQTLAEYFAELDVIENDGTARIDALFESVTDESDLNQTRDAFSQFPGLIEEIAADIEDLNPPDEAQSAHDALVEALNDVGDTAGDSADAAEDAETVEEYFTAVESDSFLAADEAFTAACLDVQKIADDNNISVDLACEDEDETAAAEQTLRDVVSTWNAKDIDAFAALFTDAGLNSSFGEGEERTREEIVAFMPEFVGDGTLEIREISSEPSDTGADVTVLWVSGRVLEKIRFALIEDGGGWKIDGEEDLAVDLPAGATVVNVDLNEFAFGLDTSKVTSTGTIVFEGHNVGTQLHHMVLAKIPVDAVLDELLASEEDPPGVEEIGGGEPFPPGESGTIALAAPLEPGRYLFVCFLPDTSDPEETPHAFKGMVTDFTVE